MKTFLLEFFGLASCLKQSSTVDEEAAHANNKRSNRGERQQQHNREVSHTQQRRRRRRRRRPSEEERHESSYNIAHSSSSKRSLPLIDENSQVLHRSNSSRSGSVLGNNNNTIDSPTQQNGRLLSSGSSSKQNSKISISSSSSGRYRKTQTYHGRDDPATLGLSLSETMGHSHEQLLDVDNDEYEYLEEQSAIRRSYKDQHQAPPLRPTRRKSSSSSRRQKSSSRLSTQHSNNSSTSKRTKLENFIDKQNEDKSPTDTDDVDNVTTISKASINPYSLLNISQSASPRDLYRSYRKKMKETENEGGGEQAFRDVGNAYRRIRAEIERQKRRKVEGEEQEQEWGQESRKQTPPPLNKRRSVRNERSRSAKKLPSTKQSRRSRSTNTSSSSSDDEESISSRATAIGARLKDHRELVTGLFANDDKDAQQKSSGNGEVTSLQNSVYSQSQMLTEMNVVPIDAGATNINEKKETIANSCFYLSLAASYLCGVGAFATDPTAIYLKRTKNNDNDAELEIASLPKKEKQLTKKLALQLKRAIEAAVMLVHPDWAESGMVGEEVQAFSDFLVYALDSDSVLGHWSIAVFDEASGFVDVYRGRHYGKIYPPSKVQTRNGKEKLKYKDCDINSMRANTLTLRYIPGHYQPLLPELTKMGNERRKARKEGKSYASGLHKRATLEDILSLLKKWNVLHVVTDGRA